MKFSALLLGVFLVSSRAFGDDGDTTATVFFNQMFDTIKALGGIPWQLKVASIITVMISSMKVSFIRPYWDKLGWGKNLLAPLLGLIGGILSLRAPGTFSIAAVSAYVFSGAGAIILHEFMDGLKQVPGVGSLMISAINFLESFLQSPATTVPVSQSAAVATPVTSSSGTVTGPANVSTTGNTNPPAAS